MSNNNNPFISPVRESTDFLIPHDLDLNTLKIIRLRNPKKL